MNKIRYYTRVALGTVIFAGAGWAVWKEITDPNAYDHLTRQPNGTYK